MEILTLLFFLAFPGVMLAVLAYRAMTWSRRRRGLRFFALLVLAAAGAGAGYGLLRLTGELRLPGDNTWSMNFFDASWRDDGVRYLAPCGGLFIGGLAALVRRTLSHGPNKEEKS